jgi:hypothetical protein
MQAHRDLRTNALTLTGSARVSLKIAGTGANFLGSTRLRSIYELQFLAQAQTLLIRC